jgi:hypothetical protein
MADAATWTLESGLSPYRVVCRGDLVGGIGWGGCGVQYLSDARYTEQLMQPDRRWRCPLCGIEATWDDAWHAGYEEAMENNGYPDSDEDGGGFVGRELVHLVEGGKLLCRGRLEQYEQMVELSRFRAGGSAAPNILITCAGCLQGLAGHLDASGLRQAQRQAAVEEASGLPTHTGVLGVRLRERVNALATQGPSPESVRDALLTLLGQLPADADLTAYNTVWAFAEALLGADPNPMCECGARKASHMVDHLVRGVVFKCTLREGVFTTAVEA